MRAKTMTTPTNAALIAASAKQCAACTYTDIAAPCDEVPSLAPIQWCQRCLARTLAARLAAVEQAQGWQPIETCPKMRTVILFAVSDVAEDGRVRNWKMATGSWHTGYEDERSKAQGFTPWCWDGHQVKVYELQPTHWMPLPAAPPAETERTRAMAMIETRNAIIKSARFDTERGLSAWIDLDYGGCGQGFGGYLLYAPTGWNAHSDSANYAGHFIYRVLQVADVTDWGKLSGRTVRVRCEHSKIHAIGHIVKDDWFDPSVEFAKLRASRDGETPALTNGAGLK